MRLYLLAFAVLAIGAWDEPSSSTSNSNAAALAASRSSSAALSNSHSASQSHVGNVTSGSTVTNTVNVAQGHGGHGGGGSHTIPPSSPTAPDVYGGSCAGQGASMGATTPLFGLSAGGNQIDRVCQLHMIHQDAAAKEYLCHTDKDMRAAFRSTPEPCVEDIVAQVCWGNDCHLIIR